VITDYALYTTGWSAAWKGFHPFESTEGYTKSVTIKGFPAWEVYSKDTGDYSLYVGINDRFLVFIMTNSDKDTLYKFANSIDYNGITKLQAEGGKAPGFEAVFTITGLLAVTYLLMRRRG